MYDATDAIVISTIKYGDTSLITKCFTENAGLKSYMLKGILKAKKSKVKAAYFQPLTQLKIRANHHQKKQLNYISDIELVNVYETVYTNIKKQAIVLFLAEVLNGAIQEEEQNNQLYRYLKTAFIWLDSHDSISNFHLLFLFNLTKFLGFYPQTKEVHYPFFDLLEGGFVANNSPNCISGDRLIQFKKLLGINFDVLHEVNYSANDRQTVLQILIQYYELHLSGFRKPKSLDVLKSIFS